MLVDSTYLQYIQYVSCVQSTVGIMLIGIYKLFFTGGKVLIKLEFDHMPAHKESTCAIMYVCVCHQLPLAGCLLRFSIDNISKRLDYPVVVHIYHGATCLCGCYPHSIYIIAAH